MTKKEIISELRKFDNTEFTGLADSTISGKGKSHLEKVLSELQNGTYILPDKNNRQQLKNNKKLAQVDNEKLDLVPQFVKNTFINNLGCTFSHSPHNIYDIYNKNLKDKDIFETSVEDYVLNEYFKLDFFYDGITYVKGTTEHEQKSKELFESIKSEKQNKRIKMMDLFNKNNPLFIKILKLIDDSNGDMEIFCEKINPILKEYLSYHKDGLLGKFAKEMYGEVTTPMDLVNEMLDSLPIETWSNKNLKILDPTNGVGPFSVAIILRFMKGLKTIIEDPIDRYEYIVENIIYVCELQAMNMLLYLFTIDPINIYKTNIYWGSYVDTGFDFHMKEIWGVDKFDIIIANPPYNAEKGDTNNTDSIYPEFVDKSYQISDKMLMVTPSRWFISDTMVEHRKNMINKYGLKMINHNSDNLYFKNADIKGGISYFLTEKGYTGDVDFTSDKIYSKRNLKLNDIITLNDNSSIIEKIKLRCEKNYSSFFRRNGHINTNDYRLETIKNEKSVECMASRNRTLFINKGSFDENSTFLNYHKVYTPLAQGRGYNRITKINYLEPGKVCNASYIVFCFGTKEECESFICLLNTDLAQLLISSLKPTQSLTSKCFENIPIVPLDKKWTNKDIYEYFDISSIEQTNITNMVNNIPF